MTAQYSVRLMGYADAPTSYARGPVIADLRYPKNIGYSEYVNNVGEAFFTLSQSDPALTQAVRVLIRDGGHIGIYRDGAGVFGGWIGETDENETDVIIYAYGYVSGFYTLSTDWGTEWTAQTVKTIVDAVATRAFTTLGNSRMGWMSTGTSENPVTTSGGSTGIVLPYYRADYKRILFVLQEMAAFSVSDTTNRVMFEVTPGGTFNFWKNRGVANTSLSLEYGDNKMSGYHRSRMPVNRRNTIYAVGSSPRELVLRQTIEDTSVRATTGRLEEPLYFSWVRDETELTRVATMRLNKAKQDDADLTVSLFPNVVEPSRATIPTYHLTDTIPIRIVNGSTNTDKRWMIVGEQVVVSRGEERVRLILQDVL